MNDHYVSQTYLKHFVGNDGQLIPYYKRRHVIIGTPKLPKAICYETEGDTNRYFQDPRILDRYLRAFENCWAQNVSKLGNNRLDSETKFKMAGYIAFLRACTPTAKRLGQKAIAGQIEPSAYKVMTAKLQEDEKLSEKLKIILSNSIRKRRTLVNVDREYAHARGIAVLRGLRDRLYCSCWLVLRNKSATSFITSDNPATLYYEDERTDSGQIYIPIKPNLAILIARDPSVVRPRKQDVLNYENKLDTFAVIKSSWVKVFNSLVVKSSENVVIHNAKAEWLEKLVRKYWNWRMEAIVEHFPTERGAVTVTRLRPREMPRQKINGSKDNS